MEGHSGRREVPIPAEDSRTDAVPGPAYRSPMIIGVLVAVAFFGVLGSWAAVAPLSSAAIAVGVVSIETQRKTVQHYEGGIVKRILVAEGQHVSAGQVLMKLNDVQPRVTLNLLRGRYLTERASEARLIALRDGKSEIEFPDLLSSDENFSIGKDIMVGQVRAFDAMIESQRTQRSILEVRLATIQEEINGLKAQIIAEDRQIELIDSELLGLAELYEKGLVAKTRLLALQRAAAALEGSRSQNAASIARATQSLAEVRLQIDNLSAELVNNVVEQLREAEKEIFDLAQRILAAEEVLSRTEIRAPMSGTVVGLKVHTESGVIAAGESLLDIVPDNERLVVEAQISPLDIDVVRVDLPAEVSLTAFDAREVAPLPGIVRSVSADRLIDERSGAPYFLARVEIVDEFGSGDVLPGMPAQVMIVTGERTTLQYMLDPLVRSFGRAFREL